MKSIRIVIVDDHEVVRVAIGLQLSKVDDFEVVDQFSSGADFLAYLVSGRDADIVLMDIRMPGMDGVETTARAMETAGNLKIIAFTQEADVHSYLAMINAGARGFVSKKLSMDVLQAAIKSVNQGDCYISPDILREIGTYADKQRRGKQLTEREIEILQLVCKGWSSRQIAEKLAVSEKTVLNHRHHIFSKTGANNIASLIIWALQNHLISTPF
jgi:DNA-binding NarL/FixJ family response regulator